MNEEELLYNIIFPEDSDPNYLNYGYFVGKSKRSVYKFKTAINDSQLNPIIICDGNKENAFFAKVFQSEVDRFLKIVNEFNFKQIRIKKNYLNEIKRMFGEAIIEHQKKVYKAAQYQYPSKNNSGIRNWEMPVAVAPNQTNENQPSLKRAI